MFAATIEDLNAEQRAAVEHGGGPLRVVAGAGTGKTRTLAARVAALVDGGVPPERILLLTFTKRAAGEMLRRADRLIRGRPVGRVWGGTFHGTAHRLLRRYGEAVGLDPSYTILDQADTEGLFGVLRAEADIDLRERRFPRKETIAAAYGRCVNAQEPLHQVLAQHFAWCSDHEAALAGIFVAYSDRKRRHNVLDYDDLLLYWRALLGSESGTAVAGLFDHVLVDEYQDTNAVQADILEALCGSTGNLTVVGDDAQAIYGFRAASAGNLLAFSERFPGTVTVWLEENYRSTPQILAPANDVMAPAIDVIPKRLWSRRRDGPVPELVTCADEGAQADLVCDRVLERRERGVSLREQAVLFRTGHHSAGLELELARRDIPFVKFGGLKFLEAAHVKDLVAMLRVLENPRDELAWNRVLMLVPGVGQATATRVTSLVLADGRDATALCRVDVNLPAEARPAFEALQAGLARAASTPSPAEQIEAMLEFCEITFEHCYDDPGVRLGDLDSLVLMAARHETRSSFLAELALDPPVSTGALAGAPHLDDDYLVLSTIHSAKGGEWRAVHVIHASDGNIPSDMALGEPGGLEEERRLLYVALTRARDELVVSVPQRYYHRRFGADAAYSYAPPSRFLEGVGERFVRSYSGVDPVTERSSGSDRRLDPVAELLSALWTPNP